MVSAIENQDAPATVLQGMRQFLGECPALVGQRIATDLTERGEGSLALAMDEEAIQKDIAGNRVVVQSFWLYRSCLVADEEERRKIQEFLETVAAWIRTKDEQEEYPILPEGHRAEGMVLGKRGLLEASGGQSRNCRLEIKLEYTHKSKRRG